jgi:D-3-phosphoglycerate dehydrogenase / 2-oxoglutarate reductase
MTRPLLLAAEGITPQALAVLSTRFRVEVARSDAELSRLLPEAVGLWVRLARHWGADELAQAKSLSFIASPTTGTTHLDEPLLGARKISLFCLRGETEFLRTVSATAELAWGLVLSLARKIPSAAADVREGRWERDRFQGVELQGKTLGILGLGRLGMKVARYGQAFGMDVLFHDSDPAPSLAAAKRVDAVELFPRSDVLSVHIPANGANAGFVSRELLARMRPGSIFINTSRGEVVDEKALADLILQNRFLGCGLDVLTDESRLTREGTRSHPLTQVAMKRGDVVITPHIGGLTQESLPRAEEHLAKLVLEGWKVT